MKQYLLFSILGLFFNWNINAQFVQPPPPCGLGYVLTICDGPEDDGFGVFSLNDAEVWYYCSIPGSGVNKTYYLTEEDGLAQTNAIANPEAYTNTTNPQNIYVRIESGGAGDPVVREFPIQVLGQPTNNPVSDFYVCDDNNDGFAEFSFLFMNSQIGENNACTTITYHVTNTDAENGANALPTDGYVNTVNPQVIYSREESQTGNYVITSFYIQALESPVVNAPSPFEICDDATLDGFAEFDLTEKTAEIIGGNTDVEVTYHESLSEANNASNPLPTTYINTINPQTIYARVTSFINYCFVVTSVNLEVVDCTDTDSDGVNDGDEDRNGNGNLDDDDTDGDEIPDYLDDDDDGDNIDTIDELNVTSTRTMHPFVDTDGDLIENYIDDDDDGDGVLTKDEDYNNNGDPTDDDTNMNGIPDYLESSVALSVQESYITDFEVYPNPATDNVNLRMNVQGEFSVAVYNILGDLVLEVQNKRSIEVSSLRSGIYFVKVSANTSETVRKLIVQ